MDQLTKLSMAYRVGHDWRAPDRVQFERRFRAAARHSRLVRVLRLAAPLTVALLGVAVAIAWVNPFAAPQPPSAPIAVPAVTGKRITMELPRLAGFTRDSRAYEFHAKSAAQDLNQPNSVELTGIRAKFELQERNSVELLAPTGLYDSKAETLILGDDIVMSSTSGYEARLREATVYVRSGRIVSEQPVEVKLLNGTLNSKRLEIAENGAMVRFDGGVELVLVLGRPKAAEGEIANAEKAQAQ